MSIKLHVLLQITDDDVGVCGVFDCREKAITALDLWQLKLAPELGAAYRIDPVNLNGELD